MANSVVVVGHYLKNLVFSQVQQLLLLACARASTSGFRSSYQRVDGVPGIKAASETVGAAPLKVVSRE